MEATAVPISPAGPLPMATMRRDLQTDALTLAAGGAILAGLALLVVANSLAVLVKGMVPGLILWAVAATALAMRRWHYLLAAWLLVGGSLAAVLLVATWGGFGAAGYLLAVPVGLAALLVSGPAGVALALVATAFAALTPPAWLDASTEVRLMAGIGVWCSLGLIWLATRPLFQALRWSWSSYEQGRKLLEESRDTQMRLKQTLADLAEANVELARWNHLAQGLRRAADDARRAKEQFVANVSHELRTPLNMIIGFSRLIVEAPTTYAGAIPGPLLSDLEVVYRNAQHLSRLIDDVLALSQAEAKQMPLIRERTAIETIIAEAIVAVRPLFESKGLYLRTAIMPALPEVFCDPTRIREVVLNLLSNAGRFTDEGGVDVAVWREEGDLLVSVADTGPGIAEEDKEKLFRPFQQLDGSLGRRYGGTGLGLTISKHFVELHGGKMWLKSEPGQGTTLFFRLPIDPPVVLEGGVTRWIQQEWEYRNREQSTARAPTVRPRLVVLEEGEALKLLLRQHLDGAEIVPVTTLPQALDELARLPAQALLVNDLAMSDALTRMLSAGPLPYGVPAILCAIPGMNQAAGQLGVADYLVKPVSRDALLAALDRLALEGRTILIADDEPEAQRLFWRMLAAADRDYRVLTASDGVEALALLRAEHPAALLLDLVMPEMDGFQLLAQKGADAAIRDIPVVVVSAQDPAGQPIVTRALAIARGGGLSMSQVLACVEGITGPLGGLPETRAPALPTTPPA